VQLSWRKTPILHRRRIDAATALGAIAFAAMSNGAEAGAGGGPGEPRGLLAFETPEGIHFINIDGSHMRRMPGTRPGDQNPHWSPDGRKLVFWYEHAQRGDIYVANADGSGRSRRTSDPYRSHEYPAWSPDGRSIAFEVGRRGERHVSVMRPDGSGLRQITRERYGGFSPRWSPSSRKLVFTAAWAETGIATVNVDGSSLRPLKTKTVSDWAPAWAPHGRAIAFTTEAHGKSEVYTVDVATGQLRRLTRNNARDFDPSWSPDGRFIVFTTGRIGNDEVYVMRPDGTRQRRVTRLPRQYACCADWRP
jgi:TolB protein